MEAVGSEAAGRRRRGPRQKATDSLTTRRWCGVLGAARGPAPAAVLCGDAEVRPDGVDVFSLVERFGAERALGETRIALEELAAEVATRAPTLGLPP
jgi:hypothetical protein